MNNLRVGGEHEAFSLIRCSDNVEPGIFFWGGVRSHVVIRKLELQLLVTDVKFSSLLTCQNLDLCFGWKFVLSSDKKGEGLICHRRTIYISGLVVLQVVLVYSKKFVQKSVQ